MLRGRKLRMTLGGFWASAVVLTLVAGCGQTSKVPPLAEVTGQVTFNGKPVTGGVVAFNPDSAKGTTGPMGGGGIDENGHYRIKTGGQPGAQVGWHVVTVEVTGGASDDARLLVPREYTSPETSPLQKEVKAGEANVINLELSSKP